MTDSQWNQLLAVLRGEPLDPLPVGFIIDSPWLPNWCGHDIADYLTCDATWWENHRFSVSRGPLNIASFRMGTTEFLVALKTDPEPMRRLLRVITDFLVRWHALQRETFPTIDGILVLDDLVGFMGETDFLEFGRPYLRDLFAVNVAVKFFHNDAPCAWSLAHYADLGINLYNPGIQTTLPEMRRLSGGRLTILGSIPPRDVLAKGSPDDVRAAIKRLLEQTPDRSRLILSCAGGMPPGVSTENIRAFREAAQTKAEG